MHRDSCSSNNNGEVRGAINLEFVVHRKGVWLGPEAATWERWIVNVILKTVSANEKEDHRRQISNQLRNELCNILEHFNSPSAYAPSLGSSQVETEHIIDFSMCGISPYRFSINYLSNSCQSRSGTIKAYPRVPIFSDSSSQSVVRQLNERLSCACTEVEYFSKQAVCKLHTACLCNSS
ncbi:unnamed protein product [Schistosoma haematobium]|nr:unnamed protein product [Schistosoma haematobium]